jgi:hypothetical protein
LIVRRLGRGGLFLGSNGGWGSWNLTDRRWKPFIWLRGCELWTLLTASDIIEVLYGRRRKDQIFRAVFEGVTLWWLLIGVLSGGLRRRRYQ